MTAVAKPISFVTAAIVSAVSMIDGVVPSNGSSDIIVTSYSNPTNLSRQASCQNIAPIFGYDLPIFKFTSLIMLNYPV